MPDTNAGGFEYRGKGFHFKRAECRWEAGSLFLEAKGKGCGLRSVGVPFPTASSVADLAGQSWEPDEEQLAIHADTFAEGGLTVRNKDLWIMGGRVACKRYDAERGVLVVSFCLSVQDGEDGRENEADGMAYCQVLS